MRIALLADIHGNLAALEAVAADLRRRGADRVVNLGDSLSGPLLPRETAHYLMSVGWLGIAGNHERQILTDGPEGRGPSDAYARSRLQPEQFEWIASLPACRQLTADVFLCHGTPASDREYLLETAVPGGVRPATRAEINHRLSGQRSAVVACAHSHVPRAVRTGRGQLLVNPGSVGLPAFDDVEPVAHVVETGSPDARYAILEEDRGSWTASLIAVPYAHEPMAALARQRERPDWAAALRTGYLSEAG